MGKLEQFLKTAGANVSASSARRELPRAALSVASLPPARIGDHGAYDIELSRIVPDPNQPRQEFDQAALERLASSLKARGQIAPVRVRWDEAQDVYVLIAGERRWHAAKLAGLPMLSCVLDDRPLDAGELLALQLVENCVREDLAPIEQAKAFRTVMERMGWSGNRLAQELGIAQPAVVAALALLKLPADVQAHVEQGDIDPSTAYEIGKAGDAETIRAVAADVREGKLTRAETRARVRQVAAKPSSKGKAKGSGKPAPIKSRVIRTAAGRVTIDLRKAGDAAAILAALREAVAVLEAEQAKAA